MDDETDGANCSPDTKRDFLREALLAKIGLESAQETVRSKNGTYRSILKRAGKAGVDTDALTTAIKLRFEDPDALAIMKGNELEMLELSGRFPNLFADIKQRYQPHVAPDEVEEETQVLVAYDNGVAAGRAGYPTDTNPYHAGTVGYVKFLEGWHAGQRTIADEMAPKSDAPPAGDPNAAPKKGRGRPKKAASSGLFAPDTPEVVAAAVREDDQPPPMMH
jgi:hypothetical protein